MGFDARAAIVRMPAADHLRRYRVAGAWRDRTIADWARLRAEAAPDSVVFPDDPGRPSYASLLEDAAALAIGLADIGVDVGDVVAFQLPNWIEAAVLNLACAIAGFVISPIVPIYRRAEVGHMLADSGAKIFFYSGAAGKFDYGQMVEELRAHVPALRAAIAVRGAACGFGALLASGRGRTRDWKRVDPDAVKLLLYTSGTTGTPKAVLHSHNTLGRVEEISCAHWGLGEGAALLMPSPVTHISGYANGLELPFVCGTRSVLMESWNAQAAVALIERYQIAGTVAATPFLKELADTTRAAGKSLPSLRVFACGGAAVPASLVAEANEAFAQPCAFRVFGASEVPLVTLGYPAARYPKLAAGSDGQVIDYELQIVDMAGRAVAPGVEGEILVRGPSMFMGYADAAQTAEAVDGHGFFRTGDLGMLAASGALIITGRKKDLIIRGGENISAKEIEDVLVQHPGVQEAAVVAMPHPRLGEGICAFVIVREPAPDAAELAAFVGGSGLAKQKTPERIELVAELPRTASGKVRKDVLRAQVRAKMAAQHNGVA